MTSTTTTTTTSTTTSEHTTLDLDLSWLNESVMEAALDAKNLSLSDVNAFHESLQAAEEFGSMDKDTSERLHEKISAKSCALVDEMVAHETARVAKRIGLYHILKVHKVWEQVQYMADQHGQGAYIVMHDFKGLDKEDIAPALAEFHAYIDAHLKAQSGTLELPYSPPGHCHNFDERARALIETKVAEKIAVAYLRFYNAVSDPDQGGYDEDFLASLQHTPKDFGMMLGVVLPDDVKNAKIYDDDDKANDRGFKTDDEDDDDNDNDDDSLQD